MRGFLIVLGTAAALIIAFASSASAFGPPPRAPTVTCDTISVDPPAVSWIKVTFSGDINGVPFSRSVPYGAPVPHMATANIIDLMTATGAIHITADATWTLGPGTSDVANVTLTCHAAPTITTEGFTATATTNTTIAPATAIPSLPLTGASTGPLAATGALAVLTGLAAILGPKRHRRGTP